MEIGPHDLEKARDPGTPDVELSRIAGAAMHAKTASTEMKRAVLAAVAGNPNTSPEWLVQLALGYTDEVVHNPALVLLTLENPALIATMGWAVLERIITHPDAPTEWLRLAAQRSEMRIRAVVARSPRTPRDVLARLADSSDAPVRIAVAGNPGAPPEVIARFARTEDEAGPVREYLRLAVAANRGAPIPTLELLAEHPAYLALVAGNPALPAYLFDVLATHQDPAVRAALATQARLPVRLARRLAGDPDIAVRRALALHRAEPDILGGLLRTPKLEVAIARNPRAPEPILRRLTRAPHQRTRDVAAESLRARKAP